MRRPQENRLTRGFQLNQPEDPFLSRSLLTGCTQEVGIQSIQSKIKPHCVTGFHYYLLLEVAHSESGSTSDPIPLPPGSLAFELIEVGLTRTFQSCRYLFIQLGTDMF